MFIFSTILIRIFVSYSQKRSLIYIVIRILLILKGKKCCHIEAKLTIDIVRTTKVYRRKASVWKKEKKINCYHKKGNTIWLDCNIVIRHVVWWQFSIGKAWLIFSQKYFSVVSLFVTLENYVFWIRNGFASYLLK